MALFIPCQRCGKQYTEDWNWWVCDTCGYRICMDCYGSHSGPGNGNNSGGGKCSQCQMGWLHLHHGIKSSIEEPQQISKLDEYLLRARGGEDHFSKPSEGSKYIQADNTKEFDNSRAVEKEPSGILLTNSSLIARKYKKTSAEDVREIIESFISSCAKKLNFVWEFVDFSQEGMAEAIGKDASWIDYAQFVSDYATGIGLKKSAETSLFIVGGGDVIPMPEFYANIGHDVKTIEDSDLLYCFPVDYSWKKVSIKDAIFNVSRLPLDYAGENYIKSSVKEDLGAYFKRVLNSLSDGIPFTYALMTSNAGETDRNDWTWTSADVMVKLPQQQLKNDGILTKDNMFLCPSLDVAGEEHMSNDDVKEYKDALAKTDMLFINLHGSPNKSMSGYLGAENRTAYWGMTLELIKQVKSPIINAFPCYGARYGRYFFDNNDGSVPDYDIFDREDSMLLSAFYESNALLFTGSCTCSMCSSVIGSGSITDHINESENAVDLLMPAGYAEAMLKLYACYLIKGEHAGYAFLHAKIDYLNYRARYENMDLVFLTLNQFNLFGCPILYLAPQDATYQLRVASKSFSVEPKELPEAQYKKEFDRQGDGIDGILGKVRALVDKNLKELDERIRVQLYDTLGISEDNLARIESFEYNGQITYTMTYAKENKLYPEFFIVQSDKDGNIKEVLESR